MNHTLYNRFPLSIQNRLISTTELARLLDKTHPKEDPNFLRESRIKSLAKPLTNFSPIDFHRVHSEWKSIYNARLHDTAYEEMADAGEQCDGELPSWQRDRLRVEKDKTADIPSVSAHEATVRLKQKM
jgi:hypothetical protein